MSDTDVGSADEAPTLLQLLRRTTAWLEQRHVESPRLVAEHLLAHGLGKTRMDIYLSHDRPMSEAECATLRPLVARAGTGEPLAYVLGEQPFRNVMLQVDSRVLIPRPETEELVDLILPRLASGARVLDLGTGSGAIALALAQERPDLKVTASDVSEEALAVARANAERLELPVTFWAGSWWEALEDQSTFDAVVSNPPYIDPDGPAGLADDVRRFEPGLALFTPDGDPGAPYEQIVAGCESGLVSGGFLAVETGLGSSDAARDAVAAAPWFADVQLINDLAAKPRFVTAVRV